MSSGIYLNGITQIMGFIIRGALFTYSPSVY
jgi:hypothetical protein